MALETLNTAPATAETPEATGSIPFQPAKSTGIAEKLALDPTQTQDILANMQKYIDERQGFIPSLAAGINKARAGLAGPSALAAHDREQMLQDKQIMDYRTQMATFRAAQAQAERDAQEYAAKLKPGAPVMGGAAAAPGGAQVTVPSGGMTYAGIPVPDSVQARLTNNATQNKAVMEEWLKTRGTEATKKEFAPGMQDVVEIWVPGQGTQQMTKAMAQKFLERNPTLQAIVDGNKVPAATVLTPAPAAAPTGAAAPAATSGQAVKIATDLGIPIISGDRDWDKQYNLYLESKKPGYTGNPVAFPGTSKHQTGNAIDAGPLTAAQRQALTDAGFKQTVPNDKNHWELVTAPAAVSRPATTPTTTAAAPSAADQTKPLPGESKTQYELRMKQVGQIGESRIKEGETERTAVLDAGKSSIETGNAISRIENVLNTPEGSRAVGIFNKPGVVAAFGKILSEGVQAGNFGSVSFKGLEDAVRAAGGDQKTINAAQNLARDFAQMQLNIAKRDLKGQGAVSDNERRIVERVTGSTANSPEVLKDFARWNRVRNDFDRDVARAAQDWEKSNPNQPFTAFKQSDDYKNLENAYIAKTDAMANKMGVTGGKSAPSGSKVDIDALKKKYGPKKES